MRIKLLLIGTGLLVAAFSSYGQCISSPTVSIAGQGCVGSVLQLNSSATPVSVVWKRDGQEVSVQTSSFAPNAITVAGGKGKGSAPDQLNNPNRICMDAQGNLFIPDMSNHRVQKWAPGATSGITVAGGNGEGAGANQFNRATSVFVDVQGNIYVTDQYNYRVQKWAPGATSGITVAGGIYGYLDTPTGVFVDSQGNIYVSAQGSYKVFKWVPATTSNSVVAGTGGWGTGASQFASPTGIYVDAQGNVFVCDTDNSRVQKWAPGASAGVTVAGGKGFGSAPDQLANPIGIYVDAAGNVYVSDYNNQRVQKWVPGATSGITVAGGKGRGSAADQLYEPTGLAMDADGNLYVSDFFNDRVQKFTSTIATTYTTTQPGTYTATITTASGCTVTSNSITVLPYKTPRVEITADKTSLCPQMPVTLTATATDGGTNPVYQWKKNGVGVGTNASTCTLSSVNDGDKISCVMTPSGGCLTSPEAVSNTITLSVASSFPRIDMGPDTTVCPGTVLTFKADAGFATYLWQDGSTSPTLVTSQPGTYWLKVQDFCGRAAADTVIIHTYSKPSRFLPQETQLCTGAITLTPSVSFNRYLWSTNDSTREIEVSAPGLYWLQVMDQNGCVTTETTKVTKVNCVSRFHVPSAFTPNGDGKNDSFKPLFIGNVKKYSFAVYNRWGNQVFAATATGRGWNGMVNGMPADPGVYVWTCSYQYPGEPVRTEKGTTVLIR